MDFIALISLIDNSLDNATWIYWSDEIIWKNHETLHQVRNCTYKAKTSLEFPAEIPAQKHNQCLITIMTICWKILMYHFRYIINIYISSNNLSVCVSTVLRSVAADITVGDSVHDSVLRISRWGTCRMDLSYSLFYIISWIVGSNQRSHI